MSDVTTPTDPAARTLVLVRHAKASNDAPSDLERPLTQRGWSMSEELADELRLVIGGADLLLVSPATRAQHTSRPLERRLLPQSTRTEEAVYRRGPTLISVLVIVPVGVGVAGVGGTLGVAGDLLVPGPGLDQNVLIK